MPHCIIHHVRFASRLLHFIERPEFGTVRLESCLYGGPFDTGMAVHVRFEAGLQGPQQVVALLSTNVFRFGHLYTPLCLAFMGTKVYGLTP